MNETASNNKRILKNTLFLYVRMFLVMGISLYTSRVILKNLGVVDFGIYNVVGGVVAMMAVVNSSMAVATQRYITFSLGRKDYDELRKVFNTSLLIYLLLSILLIILTETIGLWWVCNKLIVPADRFTASLWVYQFAILGCILSLLTNPYNATIIAHEKMDYYAYLSIVEVVLKLGVAYAISTIAFDGLIVYGFLLLAVQAIILTLYFLYCRHYFEETRFKIYKEYKLFKELLSYSGWNLFAAFSGVAKGQGLNILLNAFFGPGVNAARGIAFQINTVVIQFFTNFYTAVKPQITKYYAQGNLEDMNALVFRSAKMSFFLILLISLPIMIETPMIIDLWLDTELDFVVPFTRLIILISAIDAMASPLMTVMHATGRIKVYQLVISVATIMILPASYIMIKFFDCSPLSAFWISLTVSVFCMFARLFLVNRVVQFPMWKYTCDVYLRCTVIGLIASILPLIAYSRMEQTIWSFLWVCTIAVLSSVCAIWIFGLRKTEKHLMVSLIKTKLTSIIL